MNKQIEEWINLIESETQIEPDSAFSMYVPRLWTRDIAVIKSIELDASKAEYSPKECPANKLGITPVSAMNFW